MLFPNSAIRISKRVQGWLCLSKPLVFTCFIVLLLLFLYCVDLYSISVIFSRWLLVLEIVYTRPTITPRFSNGHQQAVWWRERDVTTPATWRGRRRTARRITANPLFPESGLGYSYCYCNYGYSITIQSSSTRLPRVLTTWCYYLHGNDHLYSNY